jgi:short-subunit dehydrogenase
MARRLAQAGLRVILVARGRKRLEAVAFGASREGTGTVCGPNGVSFRIPEGIVGSLPSQGAALYSATKSFVDAFTSSLFRELKGTDVHISVVRPGAVHSAFFDKVAAASAGWRIRAERLAVSLERVAERVWSMVQRPRRLVYVPATLVLVPWIELTFGWLIDRLGPLALRRR